jgi:transcriptional regulator with XRE-family HTH domain
MRNPKTKDERELRMTQAEIAAALRVSRATVSRLLSRGGAPGPDAKGMYRLGDVLEFRDTEAGRRERSETDIGRLKARKLELSIMLDEIEVDRRKGSLVEIGDHKDICAMMYGIFNAALRQVPSEVERWCVMAPEEARRETEKWVYGRTQEIQAEIDKGFARLHAQAGG